MLPWMLQLLLLLLLLLRLPLLMPNKLLLLLLTRLVALLPRPSLINRFRGSLPDPTRSANIGSRGSIVVLLVAFLIRQHLTLLVTAGFSSKHITPDLMPRRRSCSLTGPAGSSVRFSRLLLQLCLMAPLVTWF
jgi:hypothetical protein